MKKKILLFIALITIACCFLAVSVSAANEVTLTSGENVDLATAFNVTDNTVNGFNTGYSKDNIKDVIFPNYITTVKNVSFQSSTVLETVTFEAAETLVLDNVSFRESSVQKATFDPDCELNYKSGGFYNCKSFTEITFPKFVALPGNCFQANKNMVPTNGIVFVEGITTIACHIFNGCINVGGTVTIPSTVKEIKEGTFNGTSITAFDFSKCTNLTTIGGGYGGTFSNIDTVTSYDFSACTSLTTFNGNSMFEGSAELTNVILPANLTKIPHKTFAHCYKMQSVVIPATVTDIADESFHSARSGQTVKTFTMYIQGNVKLNTKYVFRDSSAKVEFVLLGDSITAEQFKTTNAGIDIVQSGSHSPLDNIEVVDYLDEASPWTFVPGQTRTSHVIVENYCTNLALKGEHLSSDNPCVIFCEDCLFSQAKENPQHSISVTITYENGYTNAGAKLTACINKGCGHKEAEEVKALFACLGYSASEFGNGGMLISFAVNNDAINDYAEVNDVNVSYGVFAGLKSNLGNGDAVSADGTAQNGAIVADYTGRGFDIVEIKVTGFVTDEHKDVQIALGAYIIVSGEETEIIYLQDKAPLDDEKYISYSYNDLVSTN